MIRHVVMFKFKPGVPPADRDDFAAMLNQLTEEIDFIRALEVARNVIDSPRACDLLLTVDVDDPEALKAYATHPHHQPVIQRAGELCEASYVVDYEPGAQA